MTSNSTISVVINTCNRKKDLQRCLDSIMNQTYKDFKIIVVDNGSTDGTSDLLKGYDVEVLTDSTKKLSYLFNAGWRATKTDLIAFIADDAEADKDWLKNIKGTLDKIEDAGAVSGPTISTAKQESYYLYELKSNAFLGFFVDFYDQIILEGKTLLPGILCESGAYSMGAGLPSSLKIKAPIDIDLLTTTNMGIRRKALMQLAGFDENFMFNHADGDLFIRMKKAGYRLIFDPQVKVLHHVRGGPSRYPFIVGRDTAYFIMKDIRPTSFNGALKIFMNIIYLNSYYAYKVLQTKSLKYFEGISGFLCGVKEYVRLNGFNHS